MGEEVRHWFERAADLPPGSRTVFLESNCADEAVRTEVLSLLEYDSEDSCQAPDVTLPGTIVQEALEAVLGAGTPRAPVNRVGSFQLGRLLGSGGMGFVYEAHRADGEVRQRVAVKFAQVSHTATDETRASVYRRFLRERQLLASLRHPYIAGLIDAGTTAEGTPYAVIEQVDGTPIDVFCDEHRFDQAQRIRLILKLCEAVQCAHRNLIVHGDIKPENVLVTADGMPKLIDFGAAIDLSEESALTKMRAFTPRYASPEQSLGDAATVATDVYGIGAVLYRLLTGAKPRDVKKSTLAEVIQLISEVDIIPPSVHRPEMKGDLENILMKALDREPQRRYGSVPELSDDLNRLLACRPVRATPNSSVYRARRFARRHWVPLTAAAALAAALIIATGVAIRQRGNALERARGDRQLAGRLLFEVHDEIGGLVGGTKAREKLGSIAVQYLESLERDYEKDPELAWELVNAYSRLGQSRGGGASNIGDTKSALHFASKTLDLGAIVEAAEPDAGRLDSLFLAYANLVPIFEEAFRPVERREAIDRMLRLAPRLQPLREAQAYKELARYYDSAAKRQESAGAFEHSLKVLRTLSRNNVKQAGADSELATTLVGYGRSQALAGDFAGAVVSLREAIGLSERGNATEPHQARGVRQLYWSHIALGDVFGSPQRFSMGRTGEAVEHYRKGRSIAEELLRADPDNDVAKLDLARSLSREGVALAASVPSQSLELLRRSHTLASQMSPQNYSGLVSRYDYLTSLVEPLVRLGELEKAGAVLTEARAAWKQLEKNGVPGGVRTLLKAEAAWLYATGQPKEAVARTQQLLVLLPQKTNAALSENFERVQALEQMRNYAAGIDEVACVTAAEQLVKIWSDLRATHPRSEFVLGQAERVQSLDGKDCAKRPTTPRRLSKL